ncbi:MAG: peptide chain release factor N(5)-glutamine methyltransferase [Deltaproteobacteria bacterium]
MNETEVLFTRLLDCDRGYLYLHGDRKLTREEGRSIAGALRRRMGGEPLEYILGDCEFMGLEFLVNRDVLIPRPETELLVEACLSRAKTALRPGDTILDIGTGSGCIAVSLAKSLPSAKIIAVDLSPEALAVAVENARRNKVGGRIDFIRADVAGENALPECAMVVSNPPYVRSEEIDGLQAEVRREPRTALDGGEDGLDCYRAIARRASGCLKKGGFLLLEIGAGQAAGVKAILTARGMFVIREIVRDYASIERVVVAQRV